MEGFEDIRPYRDDEVPEVLGRLVRDPDIQRAVGRFVAPRASRLCPPLVRWRVKEALAARARHVTTVRAFQEMLEGYMARLVATTTAGFTVSGLEHVPRDTPCLFVSNHRDIALDSGLMNYALWLNGLPTTRIAIGDNLLHAGRAGELMRLNKSFVVRRDSKGTKAAYAAMALTSSYIRHSLEGGESVWIAQREGRAKDGLDRTDPALLKMLSLTYRENGDGLRSVVERDVVIPVATSYELDPCDIAKARELRIHHDTGSYVKSPGEDLRSIVAGITGFKGRVHIAFGGRIEGTYDDADELARALDREIVGGLRLYPTHLDAAARLGDDVASLPAPRRLPRVERLFDERLDTCPAPDRPYLLLQYANPVRNRMALGLACEKLEAVHP